MSLLHDFLVRPQFPAPPSVDVLYFDYSFWAIGMGGSITVLEMTTLKRDARYVDLCLARAEQIDRAIRAFLAIPASSSIGGWLIFQQYAIIWATVVAASQVLQAVKEYLPYKNRLKALAALSVDLNALSLVAEDQW